MITSRTITLSQVAKYLKHHFKKQQPVMIWGSPGVGKSDLVGSVSNSYQNSYLIDVRLSLWDPTDIKGIPFFNSTTQTMEWAPPGELISEEEASQYSTVVLFLDELNGASPATQAAAYQLILDRRVGTYKLPDNVVVVAAGNKDSDRGITYRMPKPLANRFVHYEIRVDFDDWLNWAVNHDQHPDVIGYLTYCKNDLYQFDPKSDDKSFATPRTWSVVSALLYDAMDFTDHEITDMVAAAVGEGIAIKFNAHRKVSSMLPDPRRILSGEVTKLKTTEPSALYSISASLAYELKTVYEKITLGTSTIEVFNSQFEYFLKFIMDAFQPEMAVMAVRILSTNYKIRLPLTKLEAGKEFIKLHGDLVLEANNP
jgi:hypothetical protein